MDGLTITVDVRERRSRVPALLVQLGAGIDLVTLAVGDYAMGDRIVERKTVEDLHASLARQRLWSQVAALRRDPRRAYLLVEGDDLDRGTVPARAIRGALLKVTDNGIRLLHSASPEDSALWLHVLARQEQRRLGRRVSEARVGRRPIVASPAGLLSAIPGISLHSSKGRIEKFGSIAAIAVATEADLQSIPDGRPRARPSNPPSTNPSILSSRTQCRRGAQ